MRRKMRRNRWQDAKGWLARIPLGLGDIFTNKWKHLSRCLPKVVKMDRKCIQNRPTAVRIHPRSVKNQSKCDFGRFWGVVGRRVGERVPNVDRNTAPNATSWAQKVVPRGGCWCHFGPKIDLKSMQTSMPT